MSPTPTWPWWGSSIGKEWRGFGRGWKPTPGRRCTTGGSAPVWILGVGGLLVWIVSFVWVNGIAQRGLYYCLLLALGPGLLVNRMLKPHWGRPRPNNIKSFDGTKDFLPVLDLGVAGRSLVSQRPCLDGLLPHGARLCLLSPSPAAGPGVLAAGARQRGRDRRGRVVAGGHFPSDVVWAGGCIYFTALALAAPFHFGDTIPPIWKR